MWDRNHANVWFVGTGGSHFVSSTIPVRPASRRPACSIGKAVTRNQNAGAAQWSKPPTASLQRQQFGERLRIAERIVQALCEGCRLMAALRYKSLR
jgi:hypothetical protein